MAQWQKPNGNLININEFPATVAHAEKLGWKRVKEGSAKETKIEKKKEAS